jgi:hypothetical protein
VDAEFSFHFRAACVTLVLVAKPAPTPPMIARAATRESPSRPILPFNVDCISDLLSELDNDYFDKSIELYGP